MTNLDRYIHAATRANTRKSYRACIDHYEVVWGGFLPATSEGVARYLADHAHLLSLNTLRQRLAALATWHNEQGFPDPTKAPVVKKVLKGIAELHPAVEKRAEPLQLAQLQQLIEWIESQQRGGQNPTKTTTQLRLARNKALILIGFWRAFRSDELVRLSVEHIRVYPGEGMELFLPRTKTDRESRGRSYKAPALRQLCPVNAYLDWITAAGLTEGPVFRNISRWGALGQYALHPDSVIAILRQCGEEAGLDNHARYTSHSLRRGFATWANANRWDIKSLMEYVGWNSAQTAMRYIQTPDPFAQHRIEQGLESSRLHAQPPAKLTLLEATLRLERYNNQVRSVKKVRERIERVCFANWAMIRLNEQGTRYQITVSHESPEQLDEVLDELLQQMHAMANDHQCMLEATISNPATGYTWD
ncbi:site-specific integrase [Vibrio parahaemolyticus]|nr:site-specific integrase [Vibrio parahaemolyticus]